jgi:ABC-type lipoprotein export system ATPase subunit
MVQIKNLGFAYDASNRFRFPDMSFESKDQWLIKGASGCGKTTLLHLLAGLLYPTEGNIFVKDVLIKNLTASEMDRFRGKEIGIVFQKHQFLQSLTVLENLQLGKYLIGQKPSKEMGLDVLERLNLAHKAHSRIYKLSQGELQRLSIARALANQPSVLLADEPTSSLDDLHCEEVIRLLRNEAEQNETTLIVVTHDQRLSSFFKNQINLNDAKQ